ncbi:MAG: DUF1343 domain-containing protein [Culturomica sp.]|jgi:uncharacterized protein YbbC (DUF1343 family)|nr:DUF1343 domain-containing protein [Culturomica sp.]
MQKRTISGFLIFALAGALAVRVAAAEPVLPGITDTRSYLGAFGNKKVAVVANHTSTVDLGEAARTVHTVDFLRGRGVQVAKIFAPEHGFRGTADAGEQVGDYTDPATGLPVISLYGNKKKPAKTDLDGVDFVLFDIQDVGVRFFTYLSTLHYILEACAENDIPLFVADRPNPNAFYTDGPVLEPEFASFVGLHPVPLVYGMTIGEYAQMINGEGWLGNNLACDLTVIPCRNWSREQITELPVKPSPNLPDKVSVMLYPSVCLFEGTVVNEGRGTMTPFQVFGHPELKDMPYSYVPRSIEGMSRSPKCLGKTCYGRNLTGCFDEVKNGKKLRLDWLLEAYRNYRGKASFFIPFFDKLAGTDALRKAIAAGKSEAEIRKGWEEGLHRFERVRTRYLIYK